MKKVFKLIITLIIFLVISNLSNSYAASYTYVWNKAHNIAYWAALVKAEWSYLKTIWYDASKIDLSKVAAIAEKTILDKWWWGWNKKHANKMRTSGMLAHMQWWYLIVWCWNMPIVQIDIHSTSSSSSTSRWWTCSSYISSWSPVWWNCNISDNWNSNWIINCKQNTTNWIPNYSSCWTTVFTTTTTKTCDGDNCSTTSNTTSSCDTSSCPSDTPEPWQATSTQTVKLDLYNSSSTCDNLYANNSNTCSVKLNINWYTLQWRPVVNLEWMTVKLISDESNIKTDRITNLWSSALVLPTNNFTVQWNWTHFYIKIDWIKSVAPFKSQKGKLKLNINNWADIIIKNIAYNFKKPFIWSPEILNNSWDTVKLKVWPNQLLWVKLINDWNVNSFNNLYVTNLTNSLTVLWSKNYILQKVWNQIDSDTMLPKMDFILNYTWSNEINKDINKLQLSVKPIISYKLWWKVVKYYIWKNNTAYKNDSDTPVLLTDKASKFDNIKIVWLSQANWKLFLTDWKRNFTKLKLFDIRSKIRKASFIKIRWMLNWEISNGIKYVEWDYKASDVDRELWKYNILIIKDGNFIVNKNLGAMDKNLLVIVLKENDLDKWNIYIKPDVTKINAFLYADGWIMSVNNHWDIYTWNNSIRTNELNRQLIINWSIISRNTIWGAILWSDGKYILPWWKKVPNTAPAYKKAFNLDLNYLRTGNKWHWKYNNYLVIIYNTAYGTILNNLIWWK